MVHNCTAVGAQAVIMSDREGVEGGSSARGVAMDAFAADNLDENIVPRVVMKRGIRSRRSEPRKQLRRVDIPAAMACNIGGHAGSRTASRFALSLNCMLREPPHRMIVCELVSCLTLHR